MRCSIGTGGTKWFTSYWYLDYQSGYNHGKRNNEKLSGLKLKKLKSLLNQSRRRKGMISRTSTS